MIPGKSLRLYEPTEFGNILVTIYFMKTLSFMKKEQNR